MRALSALFSTSFVLALASLPACSSSDAGGGTTSPTDTGVSGSDTGTSGGDTGAGGDSNGADSGSSADTALADTGSAADTAPVDSGPPATDVAGSDECNAFCDALKAACPSAKCDQKFECKIASGSCAADTKALLKCKADTGSFYCGADGFSVVSSCHHDASLCP